MKCVQAAQTHGIGSKTIQPKHIAQICSHCSMITIWKKQLCKGPLKLQLFIPIHVQITKTPSPHFMKIQYIILMRDMELLTVSTTAGGKITSFTPVRDTDEICLILNSTVSESVMYTTMAFTIGWKILHTEIKLIPPL